MSEPDRSRLGDADPAPQLRLVPADLSASPYWRGLQYPGNEAVFCSSWLALQCSRIAGAMAGLLVVRQVDATAPRLSVTWPARDLDLPDLSRLAERAYAERRAIVAPGRIGPDANPVPVGLILAMPIGATRESTAVVAIALATSAGTPAAAPESVAEQLRWGAGWLEALPWVRRSKDISSDLAQAAACLDLFAAIGAQPRLQGMAISLANELAVRFRADRVSVGVIRQNGTVRLHAMSHSATFKREGSLVDAIENAMEEAIDQRRCITYPPTATTERGVSMAHRALAESAKVQGASAMSVVLADGRGKLIGALTFERHRSEPFTSESLQLAEAIAALLGPQVGLLLQANRFVAGRMIDRLGDGYTALLGPRRPVLKLGAIASVALVLTLIFAQGTHRVTAKSVLEAELQRAAVAPFDGFVRAAPVRAGDTVQSGDLLAALDDRDLVLDRLKWRAERDKLVQRHREALAKHDRSNLVLLEPQIRQAESQLALAEEKLARARIVAPFDGIVVSGDLSQMLGSPVEKGKVLFEVAPLNSYRLIVQVDERDVRYIAVGQSGTLALAGMPGDPLPLTLNKITPVTVAEEGRNAFRVEGRLSELGLHLRPGMEGVAKIETGQRSIIWIWTRSIIDWLRLAAWKYLP